MSAIDPRYPFCFFLVGPALSGKTVMRHTLMAHPLFSDATVISSDDLIEQVAKDEERTYTETYDSISNYEFSSMVRRLASTCRKAGERKKNIIIDRLNLNIENRALMLANVPTSYNRIALILTADEETLLARNERRKDEGKFIPIEAIRGMIKSYQKPTTDQFDAVFEIFNPFVIPF